MLEYVEICIVLGFAIESVFYEYSYRDSSGEYQRPLPRETLEPMNRTRKGRTASAINDTYSFIF